jgi:hypothetical protein
MEGIIMTRVGNINVSDGQKSLGFLEITNKVTLKIPIGIISGSKKGPTVYIQAAVHGGEVNGIEVIRRLFQEINPKNLCGVLILVPILNVRGVLEKYKYNPLDNKDISSCFPGDKKGSNSERIAYEVYTKAVEQSDYVIDLHSTGFWRRSVSHVRVVKSSKSERFGRFFGTKLVLRTAVSNLVQICEGNSIPSLCVELGEGGKIEENFVRDGVTGAKNILKYLGMMKGKLLLPKEQIIAEDRIPVISNTNGLLDLKVDLLNLIRKHKTLAIIRDEIWREKEILRTPKYGIIKAIWTNAIVTPGERVVWLATKLRKETMKK